MRSGFSVAAILVLLEPPVAGQKRVGKGGGQDLENERY